MEMRHRAFFFTFVYFQLEWFGYFWVNGFLSFPVDSMKCCQLTAIFIKEFYHFSFSISKICLNPLNLKYSATNVRIAFGANLIRNIIWIRNYFTHWDFFRSFFFFYCCFIIDFYDVHRCWIICLRTTHHTHV